ncbi:MAG: choice-of-anchor D domain-containing protein, partial [Imperialibacter sp.]|uniref:choice-of-anchor D domain-containing protein n=1 Tax=Imperialibacter sp. TaxID=2038411 RepID=UPI0032F03742
MRDTLFYALKDSITKIFVFVFLIIMHFSESLAQPEIVRVPIENEGTGDQNMATISELNGKIYFSSNERDIYEYELGSAPRKIEPFNPSGFKTFIYEVAPVNGKLLINSFGFSDYGREPAMVDPETGEASLLKDVTPGSGSTSLQFFYGNGKVGYFGSYGPENDYIWGTNGTVEGTFKIIEEPYFGWISYLAFKDQTIIKSAAGLWISDGTMGGTEKLANIGFSFSEKEPLAVTSNFFYFVDPSPDKNQIWRSDGSPEGTELIVDLGSQLQKTSIGVIDDMLIYSVVEGGHTVIRRFVDSEKISIDVIMIPEASFDLISDNHIAYLFTNNVNVWKLEPSLVSASKIFSFEAQSPYPNIASYSFINGKMLFGINTFNYGREYWVTDGSEQGTHILSDIYPGPTSGFYGNAVYSPSFDKVFFYARDQSHGIEIWTTDGSTNGTSIVADLVTSPSSLSISKLAKTINYLYLVTNVNSDEPNLFQLQKGGSILQNILDLEPAYSVTNYEISALDNLLFFHAHGLNDGYQSQSLAVYDENSLKFPYEQDYLFPGGFAQANGKLFFTAQGSNGEDFWVAEGKDKSEIYPIKDIAPDGSRAISSIFEMQVEYFNGQYFFAANNQVHGNELWVSDLTEPGTYLFSDLNVGSSDSNPANFFAHESKLFFSATVGAITYLFVSGGLPSNTVAIQQMKARKFFVVGADLYVVSEDTNYNFSLWKTDGTASGTSYVMNLGTNSRLIPAIQTENGLLFSGISAGTSSTKTFFLNLSGEISIANESQNLLQYGAVSKGSYIYYILNSQLRYTDGSSSFDKKILDTYTADHTLADYFTNNHQVFGEDLVFSGYDGLFNSLWKVPIFAPDIYISYNFDPLSAGQILDFGAIPYTTESTAKTLTITNNGYVDWEFPEGYSLQVSGEAANDFVISNPVFPAVLRPGESFDIDVKFVPTDGGVREAYIDLQSTDELLSSIQINLTGKGTDFPQSIQFVFGSDMPFREAPFELAAYSTSRLPLDFTSSDNSIATFTSEGFVTKKFGTVTIKASQPGNEYFLPATPVEKEVNIIIGNQTIGLNVPTHYTYGDAAFQLSASTSSGNPVKAYTSSNAALVSIEGTTATILGAGNLTVTAAVDGNQYFNDGEQVFDFTIKKAPQTISFESLAPTTFGSAVELTATGGASGQPVIFTSSNESVATIAGNTVTIVKSGNVNITATQAGNDNYDAATSVTRLLTISKGVQTITFEAPEGKTFGDDTFELAASSSSGLPVTLTSSKP